MLVILFNFGVLSVIWYEMLLWTQEKLLVNTFLSCQVAKSIYVFPLFLWYGLVMVTGDWSVGEKVQHWIWVSVVFP
jgi:hypothetical protein